MTFNNERVSKQSLATYTAQARRRGWVSFGTESIWSKRIGGYWYVHEADVNRATGVYRQHQADPTLRTVFVDQMEHQGWVTTVE